MKRFLMIIIVLLAACTVVYAQQARTTRQQEKEQTRKKAQEYLKIVNENSSEFDTMLEDIKDRNGSGLDRRFVVLKRQLDRLEGRIRSEETSINTSHDQGARVHQDRITTMERLISRYKSKEAELESLIDNK